MKGIRRFHFIRMGNVFPSVFYENIIDIQRSILKSKNKSTLYLTKFQSCHSFAKSIKPSVIFFSAIEKIFIFWKKKYHGSTGEIESEGV